MLSWQPGSVYVLLHTHRASCAPFLAGELVLIPFIAEFAGPDEHLKNGGPGGACPPSPCVVTIKGYDVTRDASKRHGHNAIVIRSRLSPAPLSCRGSQLTHIDALPVSETPTECPSLSLARPQLWQRPWHESSGCPAHGDDPAEENGSIPDCL